MFLYLSRWTNWENPLMQWILLSLLLAFLKKVLLLVWILVNIELTVTQSSGSIYFLFLLKIFFVRTKWSSSSRWQWRWLVTVRQCTYCCTTTCHCCWTTRRIENNCHGPNTYCIDFSSCHVAVDKIIKSELQYENNTSHTTESDFTTDT